MFFEVAVEKMFQYEFCAKSEHLETFCSFFLFTFVESRFLFFVFFWTDVTQLRREKKK